MASPTARRRISGPVERAGPNDLLQESFGFWPAESQVGAVLVLDTDLRLDPTLVREAIGERIRAVPRLRQRLTRVPVGCGRPVWVDDRGFDLDQDVTQTTCPGPGDERALLELAADSVATALPGDRPLWSATLVDGLVGGRTGLVLVFHHVLADGIGGLAVLAHLVDGAPQAPQGTFPRPPPTGRQLVVEAVSSRLRIFTRLPAALRRLAAAVAQLRSGFVGRAPRTCLNRPTGPRRRLGVARAGLDAVRSVAHAHAATVNDVVLTAVAGALRADLASRGETLNDLVVGIPVSGRSDGDPSPIGNQTGMVAVKIPASGVAFARLAATADITRVVNASPRGASATLLEPVFRSLATLGVVRWYISRQRRVNTFVTNLRGPPERLTFLGAPINDLLVMNGLPGNVAVAFGVLSYAGTLTVTVVADPDVWPEVASLAARLQHELDHLAGRLQPVATEGRPFTTTWTS